MNLKEAFFQDLAARLTTWRDDLVAAVKDPSTAVWAESQPAIARLHGKLSESDIEDLRVVLDECFRGLLHSTLVTIDGGSDASTFGNLQLIDAATGQTLTDGALHEDFVEYLAAHDML